MQRLKKQLRSRSSARTCSRETTTVRSFWGQQPPKENLLRRKNSQTATFQNNYKLIQLPKPIQTYTRASAAALARSGYNTLARTLPAPCLACSATQTRCCRRLSWGGTTVGQTASSSSSRRALPSVAAPSPSRLLVSSSTSRRSLRLPRRRGRGARRSRCRCAAHRGGRAGNVVRAPAQSRIPR